MMVVLNADNDFASVIDGAQAVAVERAAGGAVQVAAARLVGCVAGLVEGLDGGPGRGVLVTDLVWDLPWPAGEDPPAPGDEIQHGAGEACVVLSARRLGPGVRYRCKAREVTLSAQAAVLVDLQSPVWQDLGSGPEITGWTTLAAGVPAHIQPALAEHDHDAAPTETTCTFMVSLAAVDGLDRCERVVAADGAEYRVDQIVDEGRIDALPVLRVTRTQAAA